MNSRYLDGFKLFVITNFDDISQENRESTESKKRKRKQVRERERGYAPGPAIKDIVYFAAVLLRRCDTASIGIKCNGWS